MTKQNRVKQTEDCRVGTNPERERQHRNYSKAGTAAELAHGVAQILMHVIEESGDEIGFSGFRFARRALTKSGSQLVGQVLPRPRVPYDFFPGLFGAPAVAECAFVVLVELE